MNGPLFFACPVCKGALKSISADALYCPVDGLTFGCEAGIWRFLPPERLAALARFRREYETVRRSEGRGSDDPAFYRALPFIGEDGTQINTDYTDFSFSLRFLRHSRLDSAWAWRARSFGVLVEQVIEPLEMRVKRPLRILDLGAGNGWLSNRLAARGHHLAAVDLGVNVWDGLGAHSHYESDFTCLQAEFDHLPLDENQADLLIFNASFHYSVNYETTLREAGRVLRPDGWIVVMDTAVYQHHTSGLQMVAEREAAYLQRHGFASKALPSENFLTPGRLNELAAALNVRWWRIDTVPSWRQQVRRLKVAVRGQREPAQFPVILFTTESAAFSNKTIGFGQEAVRDSADLTDFSFIFASSARASAQDFGRIGRNAGWLLGARLGQQMILLLFMALVARRLGEVGLGQLAWVTAVLYLGNVLSTFGLDTVLLRQIGAERRTDTVPLTSALVLELFLAATFIALLFILPFSGQSTETSTGLRLYGWSLLPLAWLTLTSAALRGYEQMGWLAGLTLGTAVLQLVGTAVLFAAGGDFVGLMGWLLIVQLVSALTGWWFCRRLLPKFRLHWQSFRWETVRQLAQAGFWLALLVGTAVLLQRLGILLLGWLGTEAQTGQLAAALRLVEAARLLPGAMMGALFPVLARERAGGSRWQGASGQIALYRWGLAAYGIMAALGLWLVARPLVNLLFGNGYETAVGLLPILAWGMVPFTISLPLSVELVVAGAERWVLLATFGALVGTAVFTTRLFLNQGLSGLALGLVVGEWLLAAALIIIAKQHSIAP